MSQKFDIVIIGCGMIGSVLCLALEPLGLKIAVVEQRALTDLVKGQDYRATALSLGNFEYLEKLFEKKSEFFGENITSIVTEDGIFGPKVTFSAHEVALDSFGVNLPNQTLKTTVCALLSKSSHFTIFENTRIKNKFDNTLVLESGEQLTARLIIAADGRNSMFREYVPSRAMNADYKQTGYVATLQLSKPINTAYERFFKSGPIALLPLPGNQASLIWSLEKDFVEVVKQFDQEVLKNYIRFHLEGIIEEQFDILYQDWFPLSAHLCIPPYGQRILLMGDAAHTMHPVAGQGFNLGMRNLRCLVEKVKEYQLLGLDIGSYTFLESYWKEIKTHVFSLMSVTHSLIHLFDFELCSVNFLKKAGMSIFEKSRNLKKMAIYSASR